jgi:hypothetical protein
MTVKFTGNGGLNLRDSARERVDLWGLGVRGGGKVLF